MHSQCEGLNLVPTDYLYALWYNAEVLLNTHHQSSQHKQGRYAKQLQSRRTFLAIGQDWAGEDTQQGFGGNGGVTSS